ncbi:MAG: hypothetical protein GY780_01755 [bacterium]|nr:hypothetical protein [bacterium]
MRSTVNFLTTALVLFFLMAGGIASADELILDINGTESNATITASVVGTAQFQSFNDHLVFFVLPNSFDVYVQVEGALGGANPWIFRGPADASYLNFLRISSGDYSSFTLDSSNSITSSANFITGNVTDLEVYDGETFLMPVYVGTGPSINITINYNVTDDPVAVKNVSFGSVKSLFR